MQVLIGVTPNLLPLQLDWPQDKPLQSHHMQEQVANALFTLMEESAKT